MQLEQHQHTVKTIVEAQERRTAVKDRNITLVTVLLTNGKVELFKGNPGWWSPIQNSARSQPQPIK